MTEQGNLIDSLANFGFTDIEARIYLMLLNKPPQNILALARQLSLPRTTIYDNAQKLIEKGVVIRVVRYKSQMLQAAPLDSLTSIIDEEKTKVESLETTLDMLKKSLIKPLDASTTTQVRYFHGASGFQQMMWRALAAKDEHIGYSELGRIEIVGKKFMQHWMEEMIIRNIRDRVIINPNKETLEYLTRLGEGEFRKRYQNTRTLPFKTLAISGDTTIYNNVFAVAWWKEGEVVGVEIENLELVKTQRSIFEILWKQAKPLTKL